MCQRLLHSVQSSLWLSDRASEREIPRSGVQILAMDSGIFRFPTLFTNQIISQEALSANYDKRDVAKNNKSLSIEVQRY